MNNLTKDLIKKASLVRRAVLQMAFKAQSAHTGGSLSCVEILTTLYFSIMHVNQNDPEDPARDRLVFSKAHDCKALYAVLAERGFFPNKLLDTYEQDGGLPGHSTRKSVPGVEISAGSLGHGLPIACGLAYAAKQDGRTHRIFAVLSDGECDEGSTWEGVLFAGHHHLDNLVVIVDYNKIQSYGRTKDILDLEPFAVKWQAFGWQAKEVDGHNTDKLHRVLSKTPFVPGKPSVIFAHTVKGFGGVSRHIDQVSSHYKPPLAEEYAELMKVESL